MTEQETSGAETPADADAAAWEADQVREDLDDDGQLRVDVEGFEGPLDLLLAMARTQKVDLAKISVLALAQQYLTFIEEARRLRLEIAADYLVMAAWLTFLKSKMLLPAEPSEEGEPSGEELAALLAFRLKRLDAMRDAAGTAHDAQTPWPRCLRPRQPGAGSRHENKRLRGERLRPSQGLFTAAPANRHPDLAHGKTHGLVAQGKRGTSWSVFSGLPASGRRWTVCWPNF